MTPSPRNRVVTTPSPKTLPLTLPFAALVLALLGVAPLAHAESSSDAAVAQALYDEARALMAAGRAREACPKFEESQRLDPGSGTLINLALCYEKTERIASAWSTYLAAAAAAQASGNVDRESGAREYAARLAPRVSTLRIEVPEEARVPNLRVLRDGAEVGAAQWGADLPADDGEHSVVATAPGFGEWRAKVTVTGPHASARIVVQRPSEGAKSQLLDAPVAQRSSGLGAQRVAAIAAGAAGVVGLTVGGIFGAVALSKKNQASSCVGAICETPEDARAGNAAHDAGNVSTIATIAGAAFVAGGFVLWFSAPKRETTARARLELGLSGVRVGGTF